jgi:GntP family gluconate:H+ symporter
MGGVGILIGLGAMYGKLLADSGGADRIVDTLVSRSSVKALPWVMALVGSLIGLPMFFEVGLVLLMPVIILVARRSGLPLMRIAIPTLAGLSAMHGLVPPHPGPLVAISALGANLGLTLALGILIAIPTVIIGGPLFSKLAARWAPVPVPDLFITAEDEGEDVSAMPRPTFAAALVSIGIPVVLMLASALADIIWEGSESTAKTLIDFLGKPAMALLIAVIAGIVILGRGGKMNKDAIAHTLETSLPPIAGIIFIVGAGGGFKQVLISTGIGQVIADAVEGSALSVFFLAWLVAVLVRVATGSATVATITAAGILAPVAADLTNTHVALMVLAIGSGSLFLSHVNDAGFWLVKGFLGTSIGQTLKTWTVLECLVSVCGLIGVLILSIFI